MSTAHRSTARRSTVRRLATVGLAALLGATAPTLAGAAPGPTPTPTPPPPSPPPPQPPPQLDDADVNRAVGRLDGVVRDAMKRTGVPGVAIAVVHQGKVVHLKGYGVRKAGEQAAVDADTVFQLASVSKPIASTIVAGAVGTDGWTEPVAPHVPGFALKDPWVTSHVTVEDLFSHRSGLPDHAGDLLEDLGYDRAYILYHLRYEPLAPFRASYAYTNFGLTAAAQAVADEKGVPWEKLADDILYKPAGMDATSSRFADYANSSDRAWGHVQVDGAWKPEFVRDPDAQSPAGGVSSSARDMATWLRLQLANGELDGRRIVDAEALERTHWPESVSSPPHAPAARTGFYGLGWNVSYDDEGRLRLSHTGAFASGAHTNVTMLPGEQLGIVVLTNTSPVGVADAVALDFFDIAQTGEISRDWIPLVDALYQQEADAGRSKTDYAHPPADAAPAQAAATYTGRFANAYYGPAEVVAAPDGTLTLRLGPKSQSYPLTHYDGDTFSFETRGENAVGRTGVTFASDGKSFTVEYLDTEGLGTFTRNAAASR
ncbi:serine hydrolase [Streptomyces sp. SKN60]|uniref:serine hydrolase n=1 Tax=Streptomyces sp. SKN60 TaxID=2855506 RepID=UPI0022460000|nr:serine hydrolase [Streptomyces sp. SKN60]MCX2182084.1 serine hydrolase [Streptomyces sp. SKN60]